MALPLAPRRQPPADFLVTVFLAVSGLLNPILHLVAIRTYPDDYDSLPARFVISGICAAGLLAQRDERTSAYARPIAVVAALAMQGWYLHLAHLNGVSFGWAANTILLVGVSTAVLETVTEVIFFLAATALFLAWAYASPEPAEVDPLVTWTTVGVMGAAAVFIVQLRARLTEQVHRHAELAHALAAEVDLRTQAEEAALQASRSKSAFLANMSHELRTPLNAIIGYSELIAEELDDSPAGDDLSRVLASAHHLLHLIDEVLDLARIEAGRLEVRAEPVPLRPLVEECLAAVRPSAEATGLELVEAVHGDPVVSADPVRVRQILLNLLANAVKFTPEGRVTVEVLCGEQGCVVAVEDTGIGIEPDQLPRLFRAFEKAEAHNPTGTGLGLAIGRELAERMGGHLTAASTLGQGSCFQLCLPREVVESSP